MNLSKSNYNVVLIGFIADYSLEKELFLLLEEQEKAMGSVMDQELPEVQKEKAVKLVWARDRQERAVVWVMV